MTLHYVLSHTHSYGIIFWQNILPNTSAEYYAGGECAISRQAYCGSLRPAVDLDTDRRYEAHTHSYKF